MGKCRGCMTRKTTVWMLVQLFSLIGLFGVALLSQGARADVASQLVDGRNDQLHAMFLENALELAGERDVGIIAEHSLPLKWAPAFVKRNRAIVGAFSIDLGKGVNAARAHIASGGNVYAWEAGGTQYMPPQANWFSQYVDDVFQFVLTKHGEGKKRKEGGWRAKNPDFIHQAGSYADRKVQGTRNHYSPLVSWQTDQTGRFLYIVSWPQQGHVPDRLRSDVMVITRLSVSTGDLLRVENLVFNLGSSTYTWINAPWGGVRSTLFDELDLPGHGTIYHLPRFQQGETTGPDRAHGVAQWSSGHRPESFALVFPRQVKSFVGRKTPVRVRYGVAGGKKHQKRRDFYVISVTAAPKFGPGQRMYLRYYLGSGTKAELRNRVSGHSGALVVSAAGAGRAASKTSCALTLASAGCVASAQMSSAQQHQPVFSHRSNASGNISISSDPYAGQFEQWSRHAHVQPMDFLGFMTRAQFEKICYSLGFQVSGSQGAEWTCLAK